MAWHDVVVEEGRGARPPVSAWRRHRDAGEDVAVGGKRASTADPEMLDGQLSCLNPALSDSAFVVICTIAGWCAAGSQL